MEEIEILFAELENFFNLDVQPGSDSLVWDYLDHVKEYIEILLMSEVLYLSRRKIELFCSEYGINIPLDYKQKTLDMAPNSKLHLRTGGDLEELQETTIINNDTPKSAKTFHGFIVDKSITVSASPVEPDENWLDYANCTGVDAKLFYPDRGESTREAKEVCRGCEVRHDCLEFALQNGEKFGIWGGLSERERRRIRRQRSQIARSIIGS